MPRLIAIAIVLLDAVVGLGQSATRYVILFQKKPGGAQTTQVGEGGQFTVDFSYRNNGRGPDIKEEFTLADDGTLRRYVVRGTSTYGAAIDESFSRTKDRVEWKSASDNGGVEVQGPVAYVPIECSSELMARVVRAVALQPEGRLNAMPGGQLQAERVLDQRVEAGGLARRVSLYALKGLFEKPHYVWLSEAPEMKLFAVIEPGWSQLVEAGWEATADALEKRQVEVDGALLKKLADRLRHRLAGPIVIRNARVFNVEKGELDEPRDVFIHRGRITAIRAAGSPVQAPATSIDAAGRTMLPGLFDMHAHLTNWSLLQHLAAGVTSVRDLGNDNKILNGLIDDVERGDILGPHITPAGFIEGASAFSSKNGFVVGGLDEVKQAIDWYAQRGYPQIKIYNSFHREWVPEAVKYAHERGLRVSGHVPAFMRAEDVVRAGFDEIQHINQVMLNFFVKPDDDTRTLARFNIVAQNAYRLDLKSAKVQEFIALLRARGVVIDPTLATFEGMFVQRQGEMNPSYAAVADHLPLATQRFYRTNSMKIPSEELGNYRESYARMVELAGALHREGIPLVAGTDEMAGFTLHRELELYVKAGIPAAEALRIATWNGAQYTRTLERAGSISPGKAADLILIEGDPLQSISAVRSINLVMKDGVIYYPSEIYEALGIKPFVKPLRPETGRK